MTLSEIKRKNKSFLAVENSAFLKTISTVKAYYPEESELLDVFMKFLEGIYTMKLCIEEFPLDSINMFI